MVRVRGPLKKNERMEERTKRGETKSRLFTRVTLLSPRRDIGNSPTNHSFFALIFKKDVKR